MSEGKIKAVGGPALWERARSSNLESLAAEAPNIDESDLAAYLDGDLDAADCARVEAALVSHPDSLELLISAREALEAGPAALEAVPEALVARAQALAPEPRPQAGNWTGNWAGRLSAWLAPHVGPLLEPGRGLAFAGVAAGFMVISVAGFELGRAEVIYSTQIDGLLAQDFVGLIDRDGEDLL
jgi:anti-sigma factor RsiW